MPYAFGVNDVSDTFGTSPTTVLEQNMGRRFLLVQNISPVDTNSPVVWVNISGVAAGEDTPGSIMLIGGAGVVWETDWIPSATVSVVASAADSPVTILEG